MNRLSNRSLKNLRGIDPKLITLVGAVIARGKVDLVITDGLRTIEEQKELVAKGFSKTMKSRHLEGKAFDFIPYPFNGWEDIEGFKRVGAELKEVARELGYRCTYGGDWKSFKDYPHFQLD